MDYTKISKQPGRYQALGAGLIVLGLLVIFSATTATYFSMTVLGIALGVAGIIQLFQSFSHQKATGFDWGTLFMALLYLILGAIFFLQPAMSAAALALLLAFFFLVAGAMRIITAFALRFPSWGWLLLNGLVTFALGILILGGWPGTALWVIGLFIGIELMISGFTLVALSTLVSRTTQAA